MMRALLAMLLLCLAPAAARADAASAMSPGLPGVTGGAAVYQHVCQGCHMPGGRGATGAAAFPALAGNPKLAIAAYPIGVILGGYGGMPWFDSTLSNQQIADVVSYIRTHFGNDFTDPVTPADVSALRGAGHTPEH